MKKTIAEPTQLLRGISHKEMINVMHMHDVLCSVDKFTRILQWVQQRTLEWAAEEERRAVAHQALDEMVQISQELGLYDDVEVSK